MYITVHKCSVGFILAHVLFINKRAHFFCNHPHRARISNNITCFIKTQSITTSYGALRGDNNNGVGIPINESVSPIN